jgi:biopolymer transport protein ExbD
MTARPGRKPLDTEINVVPFIDLMAVTIAFLLITAVWTQTGAQPVSAPGTTGDRLDEPTRTISLRLTELGVSVAGLPVPLSDLERTLLEVDAQSATIEVDDSVRYEDLVRVIDACRGAHIEGVAVSPFAG